MEEVYQLKLYIIILLQRKLNLKQQNEIDEVNALVLDIGTTTTRAGYAGEDTPRVMFPTSFGYIDTEEQITQQQADGDVVMGEGEGIDPTSVKKREYFIGDNKINKFKSHMEIMNPLKDGLSKVLVFV